MRNNPRHYNSFQLGVLQWVEECFGAEASNDSLNRAYRFFEEACELVQACDVSVEDAHALVDYVFGRPVGEVEQETGGVLLTLAALCCANKIEMLGAGNTELNRVWHKLDKIRAKEAAKKKDSALPGTSNL